MGALRKAGVWLGLIEDEDDRHYDGPGYDDDFEDEADEVPAPVRPRARHIVRRIPDDCDTPRLNLAPEPLPVARQPHTGQPLFTDRVGH